MKFDKDKKFDIVTLGSDPEFLIMMNGRQRNAYSFFRTISPNVNGGLDEDEECGNCGEYGGGNCEDCGYEGDDDIRDGMGIEVGDSGNIGWDGHDATGEMRPTHSASPFGHVAHIENLLRFVASKNKLVKLAAINDKTIGNVVPTGGHIHIGLPSDVDCPEEVKSIVSTMMLPMVFADGGRQFALARFSNNHDANDVSFRPGSYGSLLDWRSAHRGQYIVHEFRALSSSWLSTEELAAATLATAGAIFEGLIKLHNDDPEAYAGLKKKLEPYSKAIRSLQRLALLDHDSVLFTGFAKSIRKEIRKLPTYDKWREEIELSLDRRWQGKQVAKGGNDILEGWKMKTKSRVPLYAIKKSFSVPESAIADCLESYAPAYGSDRNLANYALEFAKASKILGWSLKKTIYLYGIKAGSNAYVLMNANGEGFVSPIGPGDLTTSTLETARTIAVNRAAHTSGMLVGAKRDFVAIGIPYEVRESNDMRGFLELIWRLDNDRFKMTNDWTKLVYTNPGVVTSQEDNNSPETPAVCAVL